MATRRDSFLVALPSPSPARWDWLNCRILRLFLLGCYAKHTFDDETVFMSIIGYIVSLLIVGFIVGELGGSWCRARIRSALGGRWASVSSAPSWEVVLGGLLGIGIFAIIFEVAISAGLVYLASGRSRRLSAGGQHQR